MTNYTANNREENLTINLETTPTPKKRNKWLSTKFLFTLWAVILITFIVFANRTEYTRLAYLLSSMPLAYMGVNVIQHKIYADAEEPETKGEQTE